MGHLNKPLVWLCFSTTIVHSVISSYEWISANVNPVYFCGTWTTTKHSAESLKCCIWLRWEGTTVVTATTTTKTLLTIRVQFNVCFFCWLDNTRRRYLCLSITLCHLCHRWERERLSINNRHIYQTSHPPQAPQRTSGINTQGFVHVAAMWKDSSLWRVVRRKNIGNDHWRMSFFLNSNL